MRRVFVDTSAFIAALNDLDTHHAPAAQGFRTAEREGWELITTNYIVHETWALIQSRMGWPGVVAWLDGLLPLCHVKHVTEDIARMGASHCRQVRMRSLTLTDCVSFAFARDEGLTEALAFDDHFAEQGLHLPDMET